MTKSTPKTLGVHHFGLTVPGLGDARDFFVDGLGFEQVGEVPDYPAVFVSDGTVMITLWQAEDPDSAVAFDRRHVIGLHHLALRVADREALEVLHGELAARDDVQVEFVPESLGDGPVMHMMCRIPGDIRLELIALPAD
jgi:catechol 2,3-dioxygenase-like lactoylglutathione lyase family enzyme